MNSDSLQKKLSVFPLCRLCSSFVLSSACGGNSHKFLYRRLTYTRKISRTHIFWLDFMLLSWSIFSIVYFCEWAELRFLRMCQHEQRVCTEMDYENGNFQISYDLTSAKLTQFILQPIPRHDSDYANMKWKNFFFTHLLSTFFFGECEWSSSEVSRWNGETESFTINAVFMGRTEQFMKAEKMLLWLVFSLSSDLIIISQ